MANMSGMNLISKILIGALFIAVCAVVWFLLTQKNKGNGGCSGNCAGCSAQCDRRGDPPQSS